MSEDMVERVARAIYENADDGLHEDWNEIDDSYRELWLRCARAAIAAMAARVPPEMTAAMACEVEDIVNRDFGGDATIREIAPLVWRVMIDAALGVSATTTQKPAPTDADQSD